MRFPSAKFVEQGEAEWRNQKISEEKWVGDLLGRRMGAKYFNLKNPWTKLKPTKKF